jgi:hypothetical protein
MKFTLRDLLWMTTVAAILLAWFLSHRHRLIEEARTATESAKYMKLAKDMAAENKEMAEVVSTMVHRVKVAEFQVKN